MKSILPILLLFAVAVTAQKKVEFPNIQNIIDTNTMALKIGAQKIIIKKIDGKNISYDTVGIQIMGDSSEYAVNYMPKCKCMNDTTVAVGKTITLKATAIDRDGTISKHYWKKVGGGSYGKISFSNRQTTTFTNARTSTYVFRYEATDSNGGKCEDFVRVFVK